MKKEKFTNLLHLWHGRHLNILNSTVILPRLPLITGSNPSKRLLHDWGLNTHCTQNSICILEWTLGQSGDTSAGQLLCLLERGLVPLLCWWHCLSPCPWKYCMLRLSKLQTFSWAWQRQTVGKGKDWRHLKNYFLTQLWKFPFLPLLSSTCEL